MDSMSLGSMNERGETVQLMPGTILVLFPVYVGTPSMIQIGSLDADRDALPRIRVSYLVLVLLAASVFA